MKTSLGKEVLRHTTLTLATTVAGALAVEIVRSVVNQVVVPKKSTQKFGFEAE